MESSQRKMSIYTNKAASFLSLPREVRDEIYTYLLVAPEPICFDSINGSMPAQEIVQCGLVLMHPHFISPATAAEARQIFYRYNTFKIKCAEILQFLGSTPFQPTQLEVFDPKGWITGVHVLVERHLAGSNVILSHYPVHFLQKLLACPRLREITMDMRGHCSCNAECTTVEHIARELKKESTGVKITLWDSLRGPYIIKGSDPDFAKL